MKIVTWNINGIRARLPIVLEWLKQNQPDIIALQEIKCLEENFPKIEIEELGYNVEIFGQKGFNGVALLSKLPFDEVTRGFDGDNGGGVGVAPRGCDGDLENNGGGVGVADGDIKNNEQARLIEGVFSTKNGIIRVCNIYLPNGNPVNGGGVGVGSEANNGDIKRDVGGVPPTPRLRRTSGETPKGCDGDRDISDKFSYKLNWMNRLNEFVRKRLELEEPFILLGDFNIIPTELDVHDAKAWWGDALYRAESQERFRTLVNMGMTDALRAVSNEPNYSFWDFQAGAWRKNNGIRIDFLMLSSQAADKLSYVKTHKEARALERPSDHVPVEAGFDF